MSEDRQTIPEDALRTITAALKAPKERFDEHLTPHLCLWHCMQAISKALKVKLQKPVEPIAHLSFSDQISVLSENASLQCRGVEMTGAWWQKDIGPVLAFYESGEHPAAIIPHTFGRYLLIVPTKNIHCVLTAELAKKIQIYAFMFYPTLADEALGLRDLLRFSLCRVKGDVVQIFLMQTVIALLGFITPLAMGLIFEQIIPNSARTLLGEVISVLAVTVLVTTLFTCVLFIATLRLRLKIAASLQAAVWDRVLRLPLAFFRKFTAGDLVNRASGVDTVQQLMTGVVLTSLSSGTLSLVSLALMFYYSIALSVGTIILILIIALVTLLINAYQLGYLRKSLLLQGKLTGFVLQMISSISKIKMTNSAARVFKQWSEIFADKNHQAYLSGQIVIGMTLFSSAFSVITTMSLFALTYVFGDKLSFGDFITFNALFGQFFVAILALVVALTSVMMAVPLYERITPILSALPESRLSGIPLGILDGKIDVNNVNFRYSRETPIVFKNLNLSIKPKERVAFVGGSGCGKSTLFRLLLGLEQAQSGKIYYSDMDLSQVNIRSLTKQIGVVLQNSVLFSGSLIDNIVGFTSNYDLQEVEWLMEQLGFASELKNMPMGLQTLLTEQGRTLSNGQRQRLLLARALFKRPKILMLDEATSSLDNITQEKVYRYLDTLEITCLVIAHRPSTLHFADTIHVLDNGEVAQSGSFSALLKQKGVFRQLINRQR